MAETDTLLERIKLADSQLANLATDDDANLETSETSVPWWPDLRVVDVTVNLPHKPLRFRYALNDSRLIKLGLSAGVRQANALAHLRLEQAQVGAYLRFHIASTELRSRQVVESGDEPPWLSDADEDPLTAARKQAAQALIHPIVVTPEGEGFHVIVTALDNRNLVSIVFEVGRDGTVTVGQSSDLVEDLPVPYQGY